MKKTFIFKKYADATAPSKQTDADYGIYVIIAVLVLLIYKNKLKL
jgi:hypothetical protein